jgi:NADPH-dependent ferric siderophore reductase
LQWTVRRHAIEALGMLGDKQAVPHLIGALKDDHPNIRVSAARALGAIGDASALPTLEEALEDNTETKVNAPTTVSKTAAEAIAQIKAGDGRRTDVQVDSEKPRTCKHQQTLKSPAENNFIPQNRQSNNSLEIPGYF